MTVALAVMAAKDVRLEHQLARQQSFHRLVRTAIDPAVQGDPRLGQSRLGAAANTAADQGVHALSLQEARQRPVTGAVGVTTWEETTWPSWTS